MEWLTTFQQSFREPVFSFLGTFWPAFAVLIIGSAGWFVSAAMRRGPSSSDGGDVGFSAGNGDGEGDGGSGD